MIRSLLSVGSSMYQALCGSPSTCSSATKASSKCTEQLPIERIPSLASGVIFTPAVLIGTQNRVSPWCFFSASLSLRAITSR